MEPVLDSICLQLGGFANCATGAGSKWDDIDDANDDDYDIPCKRARVD